MGDRLQVGKPSWYVTSHPGQLNLAIPLWVGAMSTSKSWDVNRLTARCTSCVSVVWQCKPVSSWGPKKRTEISAALWALWLGKDFTLTCFRYWCTLIRTRHRSKPAAVKVLHTVCVRLSVTPSRSEHRAFCPSVHWKSCTTSPSRSRARPALDSVELVRVCVCVCL